MKHYKLMENLGGTCEHVYGVGFLETPTMLKRFSEELPKVYRVVPITKREYEKFKKQFTNAT